MNIKNLFRQPRNMVVTTSLMFVLMACAGITRAQASFAGTWNTLAGGTHEYTVTLKQVGNTATGFSPGNGKIFDGVQNGNKLTSFAGTWKVISPNEWGLSTFKLEQTVDKVKGTAEDTSGGVMTIQDGVVVGTILRFKIVRDNGAVLGEGEVFMGSTREGFTGLFNGNTITALLPSLAALSSSPAPAQCSQWDVSGKWELEVEKGARESLELKQSGNKITGIAYFAGFGRGEVDGTVKGDDFSLTISWQVREGANGYEFFIGKIGPNGKIEGTGSTLAKPDLFAKGNKWTSSRPMNCLDKFKPIHRLRVKPTSPPAAETKPPAPEPKPLTPPYIVANPSVIVLMPGQLAGQTTLVWDAGEDHPYAEIWRKINDGDETFVVEKGKGQLLVENVPRGIRYTYILTDSGKTLATVTVAVSN